MKIKKEHTLPSLDFSNLAPSPKALDDLEEDEEDQDSEEYRKEQEQKQKPSSFQ